MKKIPCLFVREFRSQAPCNLTEEVTPGCEWVLAGEGTASRKWDGTACAVIDGALFKRYDAKRGKAPPPGSLPCQDPDPVTGHWPHWVPVDVTNPADKHHLAAWTRGFEDGTYELIGPAINGNPEGREGHGLIRHGVDMLAHAPRTFAGLRDFLRAHAIEGVVFTHPDGRRAKIRRVDFGFPWPCGRAAT